MSEPSFKVKLAMVDSHVACYNKLEDKLLRALYSAVGETFARENNSTPGGVAALKRVHKGLMEDREREVKKRTAILDEQRRLLPPAIIPV